MDWRKKGIEDKKMDGYKTRGKMTVLHGVKSAFSVCVLFSF